MTATLRLDARLNLPLDDGTTETLLKPITATLTATDGLVVYPAIMGPQETDENRWYVTHAPTGQYIPVAFPDEASAARFAGAIGHLTDWSATKPVGFPVPVPELVRIGREHGGVPEQWVVDALARRAAAEA
ncbi:hypothetical protein [Streptomyces decoyicus]